MSASLVSQELGYPDRALDPTRNERATFVVRRRLPPKGFDPGQVPTDTSDWNEYAFVETRDGFAWKLLGTGVDAAAQKLISGEEQHALFPMNFDDGCKQQRQLLAGLIPVGKRESWMGAPQGTQTVEGGSIEQDGAVSPRKILFQTEVTEPWKGLIAKARLTKAELATGPSPNFDRDELRIANDFAITLRRAREQIQTISWYILLDFAKFLEEYLPHVWDVVSGTGIYDNLDDAEKALVNVFEDTHLRDDLYHAVENIDSILPLVLQNMVQLGQIDARRSLKDALITIRNEEEPLESVEVPYERGTSALPRQSPWPDFLFPLCDPDPRLASEFDLSAPVPTTAIEGSDSDEPPDPILARIDALADLVERVLPANPVEPEPETLMAASPVLDSREGWFVIRCVYERPDCGPLFPALVSDPTRVFQMAPFFDPDAPMRPVRIPMPLDVSPAGLRKFQKNAAFVMSDMLCGKVGRIKKMGFVDLVLSVLPWPFHKDLPNPGGSGPCKDGGTGFGIICSLSIPIVTLCALIVLIIMVSLFDVFFRWLPYLFVCLPIPGLKGKKS